MLHSTPSIQYGYTYPTCVSPSCEPSLLFFSSHPCLVRERPLQKHQATLRVHCAGDGDGIARGLAEGDSIATRGGGGHNLSGEVHAEDAASAGKSPVGGSSGVSSVTGVIRVVVRGPQKRAMGPRRPGYHPSRPDSVSSTPFCWHTLTSICMYERISRAN